MEAKSTESTKATRLTVKPISEKSGNLEHIHTLYCRAFPRRERSPFHEVLRESGEFLAFYDGELFCGFASLLTYKDLTHILYFAIDSNLRDHGYGSAALKTLREHLPGQRLLVDVEAEYPSAENAEQRLKRKHFYHENGYAEANIHYVWQGEKYEILVNGGAVDSAEFENFWRHFRLEGALPREYEN